jgi:hypothetical protein
MVQGVKSTRRRAVQDGAVKKLHFHLIWLPPGPGWSNLSHSEQRQDCPTVPPYNFLNHGPRAGLIHLLTSRHQDISLSIPP